MAEQKELPVTDLELVYLNGQEHGGAPVFKDVRLTRDSQTICENTLALAKNHNTPIRSESDCKRCADIVLKVRENIKQIKWLENQERKPWVHILSQIKTALTSLENKLHLAGQQLESRIEAWRALQEVGRNKIREDLLREAAELDLKAKYDSDAQASRQAETQAKEVRKEATAFKKLNPMQKAATVVLYAYEIENRALAAKLPPDAVAMEPQERWFNEQIKQAKAAGKPTTLKASG